MSELHLDYQNTTPFTWIGVVVLGLAIIVLMLTGGYFLSLSKQVDSWESKVEQSRAKKASHNLTGRSSERSAHDLAQEVRNANDALRHLGVPWDALFQAVESSGNINIKLLAIEPDVLKQQVKLSGEAKNFSVLLAYMTHMQKQEVFGTVYLQNHDIKQQSAEKSVRFSLLADWKDKP